MRRAFAACVAFAVLVVVAVIRFGFNGSSPSAPQRPRIDHAAVADAAIGDARVAPMRSRFQKAPDRTAPDAVFAHGADLGASAAHTGPVIDERQEGM